LLFFSASDTKRELYLLPVLPVLALLIGNYFNDLSAGSIAETSLYRRLASIIFSIVFIIGVTLPLAAWIVRREAFWLFVPGSLTMAFGGALSVRLFWQHQPLRALTSIALMMILLLVSSAVWVFPYLEQFKSPRSFASEIKRNFPATAPLYIYGDNMNDFNFYLERDVMPVLSSPGEIEKLAGASQTSYMLIKDRDIKKLKTIAPEWIVMTHSTGSTTWYLVQFKSLSAG